MTQVACFSGYSQSKNNFRQRQKKYKPNKVMEKAITFCDHDQYSIRTWDNLYTIQYSNLYGAQWTDKRPLHIEQIQTDSGLWG